jgi:hypothetical protein
MSYALLQNLIVALIGVAALLFLLDRIAPSLRRKLAGSLQQRPATAALGRWLQPAASGGHCGSGGGNSCDSCGGCGSASGQSPQQQ